MKAYILTLAMVLSGIISATAQIKIGTNPATLNGGSLLELESTNKGLLLPRVALADTLTWTLAGTAVAGMTVYNTNTVANQLMPGLYVWQGSKWNLFTTGNTNNIFWIPNGAGGNEIRNINTGGFWSSNPTTVTTDPGTVIPPASGAGTRLMWMPTQSAFRAGTVSGTQWDDANIGTWSFASGNSTTASGLYSTAMGYLSKATGPYSTAIGYNNTASTDHSTALGNNCTASGSSAFTANYDTYASGPQSAAFGYQTTAGSYQAFSTGVLTQATGNSSTATGYSSIASGDYSTTMGQYTSARAFSSLAIGRYNDSIVSSNLNTWVDTDPVFMIGNGSSASVRSNALLILKRGDLLAPNPTTVIADPGTVTPPASGAGTRLMWMPTQSAFRAGTVSGTQWDDANIGTWSFASGNSTTASGLYSTAMGYLSKATGPNSTAIGYNNTASGLYSLAIGNNCTASGSSAFAANYDTYAGSPQSAAFGYQTTAGNYQAFSTGVITQATGNSSTATGYSSIASGDYSTTMGQYTSARALSSLSIGRYNDSIVSSSLNTWVSTDPVFIIGNGTSSAARSNALIVFKNGNATLSGTLTQLSDCRLKTNLTPVPCALAGVLKLTGYRYNWLDKNADSTTQIGVIAQEVQAVFPELVRTDGKGMLSVNYQGLVPVLINAVKEQNKLISNLESQNNTNEQKAAAMAEKLDKLAAEVELLKKQMPKQ